MTVPFLQVAREVQIPVVAVMLLLGCATKVRQLRRTGSLEAGLGPTALFPIGLRKPVGIAVCIAEGGLGIGLLVTACATSATGGEFTANIIRVGAGLLFLVATSTLIELRTVRPDAGCGCFGDFSTTPVSGRTIARSTFLAVAILSTIDLKAITMPWRGAAGLELLAIVCAELLLIGSLSPELGAGLIRLGYSEPCELRHVPSARTLAALRHSKQWRRYGRLITSDSPADVWRELCWRYVVYPSSYEGRRADVVFAVFLQYRRPVVHVALVDSRSGLPLPVPAKGRVRPSAPAAAAAPAAGVSDAADAAADAAVVAPDEAAASVVRAEAAEAVDASAGVPVELPHQPAATADLPFSTRL